MERLLDTSCIRWSWGLGLWFLGVAKCRSTSHSPRALAWVRRFIFLNRNRFTGFSRWAISRPTWETVKTVPLITTPITPGLKPGVNKKSNSKAEGHLRTLQILHIQLHPDLIIPHICFDRVGEFDASFNLRRLPIAVDTIEPNRLQRPVLLSRESQL